MKFAGILSLAKVKVVLVGTAVQKLLQSEPGGCPGISCAGSATCSDRHCQSHPARDAGGFTPRETAFSCVQVADTEMAERRS